MCPTRRTWKATHFPSEISTTAVRIANPFCGNLGVLKQRGDLAGAEAAHRAAIAADPQHQSPCIQWAHCNLGNLLLQRDDYAGAARSYAAATNIDPTNAGFKANLKGTLKLLKEHLSGNSIHPKIVTTHLYSL